MESIDLYVDKMAKTLGLDKGSPSAIRVGYQMLQVAVERIESGLPIQDFLDGPQRAIPEVHEAYRAFVEGRLPEAEAARKLREFNKKYVEHCMRTYGVSRELIQATGL